jgi:hypothetical protein
LEGSRQQSEIEGKKKPLHSKFIRRAEKRQQDYKNSIFMSSENAVCKHTSMLVQHHYDYTSIHFNSLTLHCYVLLFPLIVFFFFSS